MWAVDLGMLMMRLVVGLTLVAHGYNHLFGAGGAAGTARWFDSIGLRPAKVHAVLSGGLEIGAGLGIVAGLLTALTTASVVGIMIVAGVAAHRRNGFFVFKDGFEYVLVLAVTSGVIALIGPGAFSLDRLLGIETSGSLGLLVAFGGGMVGAAALLGLCWRPSREPAAAVED